MHGVIIKFIKYLTKNLIPTGIHCSKPKIFTTTQSLKGTKQSTCEKSFNTQIKKESKMMQVISQYWVSLEKGKGFFWVMVLIHSPHRLVGVCKNGDLGPLMSLLME